MGVFRNFVLMRVIIKILGGVSIHTFRPGECKQVPGIIGVFSATHNTYK